MSGIALRTRLAAGLVATALALTLAGAALAGGGPGGPPASIRLATPAFAVDRAGQLVMTSTVTFDLPGEAWINAAATQDVGVGGPGPGSFVHGLVVSGASGQSVSSPVTGAVVDVVLVLPADLPRGFRPGKATVFLEFAYAAQKPDGTAEHGYLWGYLFLDGADYPELRPAS